ncbi:MAG: phage tail sheath subtilisin-like domain-containing protein [Gammaproteobacteria bacterium]|nr:phage tail sheath subtilisin-like domain-containing protein [Gammaproteobacteria bacterium]
MPEYLAPGVFVEETSFRQKTIEGVSTSTTGFVGPCRFGPVRGEPELLTSYGDFERIYGGIDQLEFDDASEPTHNFIAHAVRAYFEEGGKRLYVARTFNSEDAAADTASWEPDDSPALYAFSARYPGAAGNFKLTMIFKLGDNGLSEEPLDPTDPDSDPYDVLKGIGRFDVVLAGNADTSPSNGELYWVDERFDTDLNRTTHVLRNDDASPDSGIELDSVDRVHKLTVSVLLEGTGKFGQTDTWEDLSLDPRHNNSLNRIFPAVSSDRSIELFVPLVFDTDLDDGAALAEALLSNSSLAGHDSILEQLTLDNPQPSEASRTFSVFLRNGSDGELPNPDTYRGEDGADNGLKSGLQAFEDLENISIVAAPGSSFDYDDFITISPTANHAEAIARRLISHCERMRYRVAVLDSVNGHIQSNIREYRSTFDSSRAALYYPWVKTFDPVTERYIYVPPSGPVTGIYARNDVERGVHKAPANEVVRTSGGLEFLLNKAQQEVLNPLGVNCLRFFEGRGYRIWGARTLSSDPEWKYLNVRRYFAFLERSVERGTQWAVFENNGEALWENVRRTIEDFLYNEWSQKHLAGSKPDQAYFVRCDRTTMNQNDLDNGRLICLIGIAPLRPAEFVIFRIGQKTLGKS